jgi:hypothetical protein
MDPRIVSSPAVRPEAVTVESAARPTPTPVRVPFAQVLALGAGTLVRGAELAMHTLPGAPAMAVSVRGGAAGPIGGGTMPGAFNVSAEGPGGVPAGGLGVGIGVGGVGVGTGGIGTGTGTGGVEASLQQAQEMNLYYLQIQQEVDAQNRSFTTLSNVMKAEHDTVKNAIGNIR